MKGTIMETSFYVDGGMFSGENEMETDLIEYLDRMYAHYFDAYAFLDELQVLYYKMEGLGDETYTISRKDIFEFLIKPMVSNSVHRIFGDENYVKLPIELRSMVEDGKYDTMHLTISQMTSLVKSRFIFLLTAILGLVKVQYGSKIDTEDIVFVTNEMFKRDALGMVSGSTSPRSDSSD